MPFFHRAILVNRLDFSVGLAEQRSYIIPEEGMPKFRANKHPFRESFVSSKRRL
jgi:hypothetical protein